MTTSIIVGDKSVEIPSATLAMGANPIRKTVEDEQVQTMAQEALD